MQRGFEREAWAFGFVGLKAANDLNTGVVRSPWSTPRNPVHWRLHDPDMASCKKAEIVVALGIPLAIFRVLFARKGARELNAKCRQLTNWSARAAAN